MEKKLKYPELEQDNYVAQVEAETAEAKKRAEQLEKQAKWDRDMALWGDMANLVTKGAAMHGGAWKIDKEEARSAVANEKLRALRESNSKLLAEYARQRMEAADADRKERNAAAKAEYDAEVDKAKLQAFIARTEAELKEKQEHNDEMEKIAWQNSDTRKKEADNKGGGKSTTGGSGSGKVKNIRYIGDWAFDFDSAAEVDEAYAKMVQADPSKAAQKRDEFGDPVFNDNPNTAQKRDALTKGGMTATPPSANKGKTAGFSSGKKAGFK